MIFDNSFAIETGGTSAGGNYKGDKTAQKLARSLGVDLEQRVPCAVFALATDRAIGAPWPIKDATVHFDVPRAGLRVTYAEDGGWLAMRTYFVVELGDGRFTTLVAQPKSFGMTAGDTRAGLDAVIAGLGDAAEKVDA